MISEDNSKNLRLMIGKTISDIDISEDCEKAEIRVLMTDGDIFSIDADGDYTLFLKIRSYKSLGD